MSAYQWMVAPLLALALTGCGGLAEVREARQTERADPVATATVASETVSAPPMGEATATATATPQIDPTHPAPASPAVATPSPVPATPTAAAASVPDPTGDDLMRLLDQWGSELDAEDGGVEAELP